MCLQTLRAKIIMLEDAIRRQQKVIIENGSAHKNKLDRSVCPIKISGALISPEMKADRNTVF